MYQSKRNLKRQDPGAKISTLDIFLAKLIAICPKTGN